MKKIDSIIQYIGITDRLTIIKIKYGLEIVRTEVSKMIILFIMFSFLGLMIEYIFVIFLLSPIRCYTGGIHMKTNMGCFIFSLSIYTLVIIFLPMIQLPQFCYYLLLIVAVIFIVILAPVYTKKRPIKTWNRYLHLKKMSIIFSIIGFILILLTGLLSINNLFVIGTWVYVVQLFQLILGKINMKGDLQYENNSN